MNKLPDYLQSTYQMLECVYPQGRIPQEEYLTVLALLHEGLSFRNLAEVVSIFTGQDLSATLNDVYKAQSMQILDQSAIDKVKRELSLCGYENWLREHSNWQE